MTKTATTTLMVNVTFDPDRTDEDSVATALDRVLETALSMDNLMDDYGPVEVGEFLIAIPPDLGE